MATPGRYASGKHGRYSRASPAVVTCHVDVANRPGPGKRRGASGARSSDLLQRSYELVLRHPRAALDARLRGTLRKLLLAEHLEAAAAIAAPSAAAVRLDARPERVEQVGRFVA